jgi:hypothetical protein
MAHHALALFVIRERDAAIFTLNGSAATSAHRQPRIAAPVDEDERLRAGHKALGNCFTQSRRDRRGAMRFLKFLAHVHHFDVRHLAICDARIQT